MLNKDISNFYEIPHFLKIFKLNLYFLIGVFLILSIIFLILKKNNLGINNIPLFFKNFNLIIFVLSFTFYLYYLFFLFEYKSNFFYIVIIERNVLFLDKSYYFLDLSSLIILYLSYIIGLISFLTLGDRFWGLNYFTSVFFIYFLIIVNLLTQSTNVLEMFFYYELLLLPSVYLVNSLGYSKKVNQSNIYFLVWTQLGSLLSLFGIIYIYFVVGSLDFIILKEYTFTNTEKYLLYLVFFFGFGVKIPIWPLHFWLIKVHVEAPSGFSIFLSGFLVKTAVFCFYKISAIFGIFEIYYIPIILCSCGMLYSSIKMWVQTDIKKLIAYATVLEMNAIFFLFNLNNWTAIKTGIFFLAAHGILSTLMFYLVECIYKRFDTRSIYKLYGLGSVYPMLGVAIWMMLIVFFGLPGTLKFFVEIQLLYFINEFDLLYAFVFLFFFVFISSVGFARCWFSILYGNPGYNEQKTDLEKEEIAIIVFLSFLSFVTILFTSFI